MTRHADIHAIIDRQDASEVARERCRVLMRVVSGEMTMETAATQLGISRQRLHALRERMTTVSVASLEPQSSGRPAAPGPDAKDLRIAALEQELGRTKRDLDCAMIRAEIALVFDDRDALKKNSSGQPTVIGSERAERNRIRRRQHRTRSPG
jgi:hypothetical protein